MLGTLLVYIFIIAFCASNVDADGNATNQDGTFFCQYYTDHTTSCYTHYRSREANDTHHDEEADKAFSVLGIGEPIKGHWADDDGFFKVGNVTAAATFIGTCMFDPNNGANCAHAPPPCEETKFKTIGCVGGAMFMVMNYTGNPGGTLKPVTSVDAGTFKPVISVGNP